MGRPWLWQQEPPA